MIKCVDKNIRIAIMIVFPYVQVAREKTDQVKQKSGRYLKDSNLTSRDEYYNV